MAGALDGIRTTDFGQWLAGPLTALQNLRLGVAERLGVGYDQVRAHQPDIVY